MAVSPLDRRPKRASGTSLESLLALARYSLRAVTLASAPLLVSCTADGPADLAIQNVTVIDAVNGVREAQTVVVHEGRITAVTAATDEVDAREMVDASGQYLIPGLWDFHVHLTYEEGLTADMPGLFLNHGITSVRETGAPLVDLLPVVESMREEEAIAPRVFFAGPLLDGEYVVYDGESRPLIGITNPDVATARANVARLVEAGVDFLKVYEMVTPEVFAAFIEEAQSRGLPVAGHVPLSMRARDVGPEVQSLEHLRNLELDCAADPEALLAERRARLANPEGLSGGDLRSSLHRLQRLPAIAAYDEESCAAVLASMENTIQVPTLRLNAMSLQSPFERDDWGALLDKLPPELGERWRAVTESRQQRGAQPDTTFGAWSLHLIGLLHEAGVPIGAGTDTPIGFAAPGYALHSELALLVRAGLTPLEALKAATVRPAEFFGLAHEMGAIQQGYLADLVLLTGDPLADIGNTRTVEAVVSKGVFLSRVQLDGLVR